jgi:hypothetical protein
MGRESREAREVVPAAAAYAALARRFLDQPRVTLPADQRGKFGSNALKVDGKIFAMLIRGSLAVKLSPVEVEAATMAGRGEPLAMGRGRVMKGWLVVKEPPQRWYAVAERARAFVAGQPSLTVRRSGSTARGARSRRR